MMGEEVETSLLQDKTRVLPRNYHSASREVPGDILAFSSLAEQSSDMARRESKREQALLLRGMECKKYRIFVSKFKLC